VILAPAARERGHTVRQTTDFNMQSPKKSLELGTIDELKSFVAQNYVFDEFTYPSLKGATECERFTFSLNHSALHFSKTAGQLATLCERADHGHQVDDAALQEIVPKALISVLRLAEIAGLSEADLVRAIHAKYEASSSAHSKDAARKRSAA
jgi:hypothetical protein